MLKWEYTIGRTHSLTDSYASLYHMRTMGHVLHVMFEHIYISDNIYPFLQYKGCKGVVIIYRGRL